MGVVVTEKHAGVTAADATGPPCAAGRRVSCRLGGTWARAGSKHAAADQRGARQPAQQPGHRHAHKGRR